MQVLRADPHVFRCHGSLKETIWYSELGASAAVLAAGYNLDSLMLKYQGVDWLQGGETWKCNRGYAQIPTRCAPTHSEGATGDADTSAVNLTVTVREGGIDVS